MADKYIVSKFNDTVNNNQSNTYVSNSNVDTEIVYFNNDTNQEWSNWKQYDPRWKELLIGDKSILQVGNLSTALAILIAKSGVSTTIEDFNPGTFMLKHKENGGFNRNSIIKLDVTDVAPNLKFVGTYPNVDMVDLNDKIDNEKNWYGIIKSNDTHMYTVIDNVSFASQKVNVYDPAGIETSIDFSNVDSVYLYYDTTSSTNGELDYSDPTNY